MLHEESFFEKQCRGEYYEKFTKDGNTIRTAEFFSASGVWVVSTQSHKHKDISGEYSIDDFNKIKKLYF